MAGAPDARAGARVPRRAPRATIAQYWCVGCGATRQKRWFYVADAALLAFFARVVLCRSCSNTVVRVAAVRVCAVAQTYVRTLESVLAHSLASGQRLALSGACAVHAIDNVLHGIVREDGGIVALPSLYLADDHALPLDSACVRDAVGARPTWRLARAYTRGAAPLARQDAGGGANHGGGGGGGDDDGRRKRPRIDAAGAAQTAAALNPALYKLDDADAGDVGAADLHEALVELEVAIASTRARIEAGAFDANGAAMTAHQVRGAVAGLAGAAPHGAAAAALDAAFDATLAAALARWVARARAPECACVDAHTPACAGAALAFVADDTLLAGARDTRHALLAPYAHRLVDMPPLYTSVQEASMSLIGSWLDIAGATQRVVAPQSAAYELEVFCRARLASAVVSLPDALSLERNGSIVEVTAARLDATPVDAFLANDTRVRTRLCILRAYVEVHAILANAGLAPQRPSSLAGCVLARMPNGTYALLVEHTSLQLVEQRDDQIFYTRDLYALAAGLLFANSAQALELAAATHPDDALRAWLAAMFHTQTRAFTHTAVFAHTLFGADYAGAFLGEHVGAPAVTH